MGNVNRVEMRNQHGETRALWLLPVRLIFNATKITWAPPNILRIQNSEGDLLDPQQESSNRKNYEKNNWTRVTFWALK